MKTKPKKKKKKYSTPKIKSEKLITFGATCNGTTVGGRKATTGAPASCTANRLLS